MAKRLQITGAPTQGLQSDFWNAVVSAATAAGATRIDLSSGYRDPAHNAAVGGVPRSNHTRGLAVDGRAYLPSRGWVPLGDLSTLQSYGLRSGDQPGFYQGGRDPVHVDAGYMATGFDPRKPGTSELPSYTGQPGAGTTNLPNASAGQSPTAKALSRWPKSAQLAYQLATQSGLTPTQAKDFAAVQYGESGFNPNARNKSSGAAGLYQLLSSGYVNRANQLGGVFNPRANIQAILPDYAKYYRSHPYQPGAAGAAVERSGEGAAYYAQGLQHLPGGAPTGGAAAPPITGPAPAPAPAQTAAGRGPLPAAVRQALQILRS